MHVRRTLVATAACAVTSMGLVVSAEAVANTATPKPPKATPYHVNVYNQQNEKQYETTADLYSKTHTWELLGHCDHGTYEKRGHELILYDEGCYYTEWVLTTRRGDKGVYAGPILVNGGFEAIGEFIKE